MVSTNCPCGTRRIDAEPDQHLRHIVRSARQNEGRAFLDGNVQQLSDQPGGTVVQVRRPGKVEYDDLVILDIRPNGIHQVSGRRHGESSLERHQPDSRRVGVRPVNAGLVRKEGLIAKRHRHDAVEFKSLQ